MFYCAQTLVVRLTPYCQWWGKLGCWAAAQQWKLPHNPPWGAARADGISAPLLPILAWRNPRGWYLSLPHLLNALKSARGVKSALRGPLCQCRILTIKQCHVEDQPASTFRNSCPSVQVRRNPHLRSEITMEDPFWSIFHSLHLICDGFLSPFVNTVDRILIGSWFFGSCIRPVTQLVLIVDVLPLYLKKGTANIEDTAMLRKNWVFKPALPVF